jgi:hypothetical protein
VLTRHEAKVILALAETVFPVDDPRHVRPGDARVVEYLDELLAQVEPRERALMRVLIALFDVQQAVATPTRPTLFSRARPEDRARSLEGWDKSSLYPRRVAFQAIRSLLLWAYVDNPDVERSIGVERGTKVVDRLRAAGWKVGEPVEPPERTPAGVEL